MSQRSVSAPSVELLYWPECPSHGRALAELEAALDVVGLATEIDVRAVWTLDDAQREAFVGSPTIRVGGVDVVDPAGQAPALTCRVYRSRSGAFAPVPDRQDVEDALRAALHSTHPLKGKDLPMTDIAAKTVPAAVDAWVSALKLGTDDARRALRPHLAPDVEFPFVTRLMRGADEVLAHLKTMPSAQMYDSATWREHDVAGDTVRLHADFPPGRALSAIDTQLHLDAGGRIDHITVKPHHPEPQDLQPALSIGAVAPDFTLLDVAGNEHRLADDAPAATAVWWTCNHCPWALGWHDRLQDVVLEYQERGVRFLQINANDPGVSPHDTVEGSAKRIDDGAFASPYLIDDNQRVARRWGARHTPDVFVLDAEHRVVYHGAPDASAENPALRAEWLRSALDAVLDGRAPERAETQPVGCTIKWTI